MLRTRKSDRRITADGVSALADQAQSQLREAASSAELAVESARETWVDDVLPRVNAAVADAAANAAAARAAIAEAITEVAENAPAALAVLKGEAVATPVKTKRKGRGAWFLLLGAVAAGAAVAAYRRSSSKPDPWMSAAPWSPAAAVAQPVDAPTSPAAADAFGAEASASASSESVGDEGAPAEAPDGLKVDEAIDAKAAKVEDGDSVVDSANAAGESRDDAGDAGDAGDADDDSTQMSNDKDA